jgi:hypothetical protein
VDGPQLPPPPPPAERVEEPPRPRRRWPAVLGVAGTLVGLLGGAVAVQQRQVAASWQDRAVRFEASRDDAMGRGEALQRQLDEVADALATSETDVVALEDRLAELADEKAQAEDVATTTEVERDTLVALSSAIAGSVTSLDGCVDELFDLLGQSIDAFNRQGAGEQVDVASLNAARTTTTAGCNDARRDAATAAATAQDLLG